MTEAGQRVLFRTTVILPWVSCAVAYSTVMIYPQYGLIGTDVPFWSFTLWVTFLMLACIGYLVAVFNRKPVGDTRDFPPGEIVRRYMMVVLPGAIGLTLASMDSQRLESAFTLPLSVVFLAFLILIPLVIIPLILVIDRLTDLISTPVFWLLGSPPKAQPVSPTPELSRAPVETVHKDQPPEARVNSHEFDWKAPQLKLQNLVGVDSFTLELTEAISGFKAYASGKGPINDRNGFLFSGPPGNGKTTVAEAIAGELGLPFLKVGGQDITSKWVNDSASVVKELFRQASVQPCVIFFDEFEGVAMDRSSGSMHAEDRKVVNALLAEIDTARNKRIILIAATNYIEQVDAAIGRDGRFDWRMSIPYPDENGRASILSAMLAEKGLTASEVVIQDVAMLWHMRPVSFIESTVKRLRDNKRGDDKGSMVTLEDLKQASRDASRNASAIPASGAKLSDLVLPAALKKTILSLVGRMRNWESASKGGGEPPSGVVLYGPPGTGKTNLVRAIARELGNWHVFEVSAPEVLQDPREFRKKLELAARHRPAIVFIDEADDLLRVRMHSHSAAATNEILKCMDGMMGKIPEILFMAATNNVDLLDGAALRGGRFSEQIPMDKLTGDDLVNLLTQQFARKSMVRFSDEVTPVSLAGRLGEAAAADAIGVLQKAINQTFDHPQGRCVTSEDIEDAIELMRL